MIYKTERRDLNKFLSVGNFGNCFYYNLQIPPFSHSLHGIKVNFDPLMLPLFSWLQGRLQLSLGLPSLLTLLSLHFHVDLVIRSASFSMPPQPPLPIASALVRGFVRSCMMFSLRPFLPSPSSLWLGRAAPFTRHYVL